MVSIMCVCVYGFELAGSRLYHANPAVLLLLSLTSHRWLDFKALLLQMSQ